jgi:MerR family mercuric resistance operon transcriptional regulator
MDTMTEDTMAIGALSRRSGCNIETIRYYERIGLLPKASRRGRYRSYGVEDVGRLTFVRRARELGFTLEDVRALLDLAAGGHDACSDARQIAASHLLEVRAKITDLQAMERALALSVEQCDTAKMPGCPMITALFSGTLKL